MTPTLSLERGSVAVVATEFRDDKKALSTLRLLDAEPKAVASKPVETAPGWREVSFYTGEDGNVGRIYYLRPKKGHGSCKVIIGHKKEQEKDFEWLRRNT